MGPDNVFFFFNYVCENNGKDMGLSTKRSILRSFLFDVIIRSLQVDILIKGLFLLLYFDPWD